MHRLLESEQSRTDDHGCAYDTTNTWLRAIWSPDELLRIIQSGSGSADKNTVTRQCDRPIHNISHTQYQINIVLSSGRASV